jgi:CRP-like cAMP-binding protein
MVTDNYNRETKLLASFFKLRGKLLTYKKGRRLPAGDISDKVIYVKSGYLSAQSATQPSRTRARAYYTFGPGDIMEFRTLVIRDPQELTYSALTNVVVYVVSKDVVWRNIRESTELAMALAGEVILQNDLLTKRVENLSYRYASDKLIYRILNLAGRFGAPKAGQIYIRIPVTHRQLGMFINMARESVSREMEKLVSRKLIDYERQHITILDPSGLVDAMHESGRADWSDLLVIAEASKPRSQ